ncbi:MAG: TAXI family TRAP transporter solute-binding subunit [Peptoniphilaceae bacterium]|nr:TAXI family TRAP transporter solute-binding subunit [Peptoniphilaceae bacterium]MDY6018532.1 TAXI family TRAP transporter solute-binding subunit [Anaerococcus sp.]
MKNKLKKLLSTLLIFLIVVGIASCSNNQDRMMFGTGGSAGTYYSYGGVLAQYFKKYANIRVTAVSTGGSKVNIESMKDGDFQMGLSQSDVMTYAWNGERAFEEDGKVDNFRTLAALYAETVQLITMDKSINNVGDLKGKSISVGEAGSGAFFNAVDVLESAGLTLDDIKPQYQSFEDSKESLKDGKIDAAFIVAGAPTTAITELATTNGVKLVNIDGTYRDKIIKKHPYYSKLSIPKGTYPKQDKDVDTIAVQASLIVDKNASEKVVYDLTAAIFDHIDEIKKENAKGEELNLENASSITTVAYHKGAAKYFKEHGIKVKTSN